MYGAGTRSRLLRAGMTSEMDRQIKERETGTAPMGQQAQQQALASPKLLFPFLDLKAEFADIRAEVLAAVDRVLESQHFILGPEVEALEAEVGRFVDCRFAI